MMVSKRNLLFQGILFRFHLKFQGCMFAFEFVYTWHQRGAKLPFCASIFGLQVRWRKANLWRDCWTWSCWSLVRPKKRHVELQPIGFSMKRCSLFQSWDYICETLNVYILPILFMRNGFVWGAWVPLGVPAQLIYFCNLFCVKLLFRNRWTAKDKFLEVHLPSSSIICDETDVAAVWWKPCDYACYWLFMFLRKSMDSFVWLEVVEMKP